MSFLSELRELNTKRAHNDFGHTKDLTDWSEGDWALAIAGETGELCNMIKKRMRNQFDGDQVSDHDVGEEIADIIIYCDLLAARMGLKTLDKLIWNKFNAVSVKRDSPFFMRIE